MGAKMRDPIALDRGASSNHCASKQYSYITILMLLLFLAVIEDDGKFPISYGATNLSPSPKSGRLWEGLATYDHVFLLAWPPYIRVLCPPMPYSSSNPTIYVRVS